MADDPQNPPAEEPAKLVNEPLLHFLYEVEEKVGSNLLGPLDAACTVLLQTGAQPRIVVAGFSIDQTTQIRVLEWAIDHLKQQIAREQVMNPQIIIAKG
jgi:hypothetical protein